MNTETKLAKKRGPKPSGVEKVVYYRRVVPALVEKLDAVLLPPDDGSMLVKDRLEAREYIGAALKEDDEEAMGIAIELAGVNKKLIAMTKDYEFYYARCEELELKLVAANRDMEDCLAMAEEEKTKYWRNRCLMVEAAIKAKSNEFNQE